MRHHVATPPPGQVTAILVVDDDPTSRVTISQLLRASSTVRVHEACTGTEAILVARQELFALALIDYRLPDMTGIELVDTLRAENRCMPWILMSGFMDFDVALQAGRLGALRAVSVPFDVEALVTHALASASARLTGNWPPLPLRHRLSERGSAVKRAAVLLLKASDSIDDLHTLSEWAAFVGVSYTQLRDVFYRIGVQPNDARALMRVLRALVRQNGVINGVRAELDTGDYRTDSHMFTAAGIAPDTRQLGPSDFFKRQRFMDPNHPLAVELAKVIDHLLL
jgi:CheY-like chemotaxis protein